jgi:hypothetical protein
MTEHRYQADAQIVAGECELSTCGRLLGLITLTLTDAGPITMPDGSDTRRPDVICPLRPTEARQLASRLHELADQLSPLVTR